MGRLLWRLGAALAGASVVVLSILLSFAWRGSARLARESQVADTAAGPVEYASLGRGPAVLLIHGTPGGYDQLLPLGRRLADEGFRAISVSRPGYLRTPSSPAQAPAEQAVVLRALLDVLGVTEVAVVAVSGGGPVALHLAAQEPNRVRALSLVAALAKRLAPYGGDPERAIRGFGPLWNAGAVTAMEWPSFGLRLLGVQDASARARLASDVTVADGLKYLFQSLAFTNRRRGYRDDVMAMFREDAVPPLEAIRVPTLAIYGEYDASVPLEHGHAVAERVTGARLEVLEAGSHTFFVTRQDWVLARLVPFLRSPTEAQAVPTR